MSAKGISLHIGINAVNPVHYQNWSGILNACENDAAVYKGIAKKAGYSRVEVLLTKEATSENLFRSLSRAASELEKGDILFISYSGHGGAVPDLNNDEENDSMDETWCLYDRQVLDDELHLYYRKFKEGVRILIFSDSCHSGSVSRATVTNMEPDQNDKENYIKSRLAPLGTILRTFNANQDLYESIGKQAPVAEDEIRAYVMLFGACQDEEEAMEVWDHGMFTAKLIKVLAGQVSSYNQLFEYIKKGFHIKQNPNLFRYGNKNYDFVAEAPFAINTGPEIDFSTSVSKPAPQQKHTKSLIVEIDGQQSSGRFYRRMTQGRSVQAEGVEPETRFALTDIEGQEDKEWDKAYEQFLGEPAVKFAEPNIGSPYLKPRQASRAADANGYLNNWPQPEPAADEFIWHLDNNHSQLRMATDTVLAESSGDARVRIGHIDTGYLPGHPSTPKNLLADLGVSFVKKEFGENKGVDKLNSGYPAEQDGHGCATLALLAGNEIAVEDSYANYKGFVGAVPFAEVIPIRICDTVFNLINANDVADGIDYAVDYGCEVITMSMAGYPTRRVAKAVNRAYEKGVVIVTAAGNNWKSGIAKLAPKAVLYPARFDRVIAATGACYNDEPYDLDINEWYQARSEGGELMQGNWGPEAAMNKAIAAYTPNVPWATSSKANKFYRSGGGTSSSTPQVAAAAALWIAHNRKKITEAGIDNTWKKVEAVRSALFNSADKTYPAYKKYYGNGILRAHDALTAFDFNTVSELKKAPEAKVIITGLINFFGGWFRSRGHETVDPGKNDALNEMLSLEILQVIYRDPKLMQYAEVMNLADQSSDDFFTNEKTRLSFAKKVAGSEFASDFLKAAMKGIS